MALEKNQHIRVICNYSVTEKIQPSLAQVFLLLFLQLFLLWNNQ